MRLLFLPIAALAVLAVYFLVGRGDPWTAKYPDLPELADVPAPTVKAVRLALPDGWERDSVLQKGDPTALRAELARHPGAARALLRLMIETHERLHPGARSFDRAYDDDRSEAVAIALGETATDAERDLLVRVLVGDYPLALRRKMIIALCRPGHAAAVPQLVDIALTELELRPAVLFRLDRTGAPPPDRLRRFPTNSIAATLARMGDPDQAERVLAGLDEIAQIPNTFPDGWHYAMATNRIIGRDIPFSVTIPNAEYAKGGPFFPKVQRHREALAEWIAANR
jgi:hypothetical protein